MLDLNWTQDAGLGTGRGTLRCTQDYAGRWMLDAGSTLQAARRWTLDTERHMHARP